MFNTHLEIGEEINNARLCKIFGCSPQGGIRNMKRITGGDEKIIRLLDLTDEPRDVADPWYTGDFDTTYNDVVKGCKVLLEKLEGELNG